MSDGWDVGLCSVGRHVLNARSDLTADMIDSQLGQLDQLDVGGPQHQQ